MNIIDNAMSQSEFVLAQRTFFERNIPWFYEESQTHKFSDDSYFWHCMYGKTEEGKDAIGQPCSEAFPLFFPLLQRLECNSLINMRANLLINRGPKKSIPHVDRFSSDMSHKTAIFYMNTCNGKTVIDGTEVDSVENRLVTFPSDTMHYVIHQTDEDRRIVININYY